LKQEDFRDIISGRKTGVSAVLIRLMLRVAGFLYYLVILLRNGLYDAGVFKTQLISAKVISIGNITTGGTGKTPLVIWLARYLSRQHRPAILTRGYKSEYGISDEASLLANACPGTPVIINPNRVKGAKLAVSQGANILVMDDGFQHRRLARDLDILTIDATEPFGYDKLLPAGLLREPINQIRRADAVIITRTNQVNSEQIEKIRKNLRKYKPDMPIACAVHQPKSVITATGTEITIEQMKSKKVFAYCGIGNPEAFLETIKKIGVNLVGHQFYSDHHRYIQEDIQKIYHQAIHRDTEIIVTTEKDWMKSKKLLQNEDMVYFAYLTVELEFIEGNDIIQGLIERIIRTKTDV